MKRKFTLLLLFAAMLFPVFAQKSGMDISAAINDAASQIAKKVPGGQVAAVTNFTADTKELSDWLENEMFRAVSKKAVKLVERNAKNMNILNREIDFQYSGAVSDEMIVEYGRQIGARYIIYGGFEQFGGIMNFDFRLTDVETFEVVTAKSYEIARSNALAELLGDEMQLTSISDYITAINSLDKKLNSVQKEMAADRDRAENSIRMEYQKKINAKTEEITDLYEGMYSGARLRMEIENAVKPIESERDVLLKPVAENSRAKFADQISKIENNKSSILRELQSSNFIVGADSISVELLRKMDAVTESAYFSLSLRSTDKYVNYSMSGRIDPATPADFKKIRDAAEKTKSVQGELEYSLKPKTADSSNFYIVISSVRVYDSVSGDTLYKCSASDLDDTDGGTVNMVAQKGGAADRTTSSRSSTTASTSTPAKSNTTTRSTTTTTNNVSTTKTNIDTSQRKVTGSTSGTAAKSSNPFERNDLWTVQHSPATNFYVDGGVGKSNQLFIKGNTGTSNRRPEEGRWCELNCWERPEIQSFLRKGTGINFKVNGDGHWYRFEVVFKGGNTRYEYKFKTKKDQVSLVSIPYKRMTHESWTQYQKFDITKVESVIIGYCFDTDKNPVNKVDFYANFYDFEVTN